MPTVTSPNLTLSESNGIVTMSITFLPTFSSFEKELAGLSCTYDAHYNVYGFDNGIQGDELTAVDIAPGLPILPVLQVVEVARSFLEEDPAAGNDDELKVMIRIHSHVPPEYTDGEFTDQEVLASN